MKKWVLFIFMCLCACQSALSAKEVAVVEAAETKRQMGYQAPFEPWDSRIPHYQLELSYELIVEGGIKISIDLTARVVDRQEALAIYERFQISSGDILHYNVYHSGPFEGGAYVLFYLNVDQEDFAQIVFSGFSMDFAYFTKKDTN